MGVDLNELARRTMEQMFDQGRVAYIEDVSELSFVGHDPLAGTLSLHDEERVVRSFREGFPNLRCQVTDVIAQHDRAVCRWVAHGTHRGEFMGIAPTGRSVEFDGITMMRFHGDRLAEAWSQYDALRILGTIGAAPERRELAQRWASLREEEERLAQH